MQFEIDTFFTELEQNTTDESWFKQGLTSTSKFFYLLIYNEPKTMLKFGYKLSLRAYRNDYAKFNTYKPVRAYVWRISQPTFNKPVIYQMRKWGERYNLAICIFKHEQSIHKMLAKLPCLKRIPRHKEVYFCDDHLFPLEEIRNMMKSPNEDFKRYRSEYDEQRRIDMRKYGIWS